MATGKKTGGRTKGTPNKASAKREAEIAKSGLTPLQFMLQVMRDDTRPDDMRLEAAKSAAPYVHPKLAQVEMTTPPDNPFEVKFKSDNEFARRIAFFLTKAVRSKA